MRWIPPAGKAKKTYPMIKRIELDRGQSQAFLDRVNNRTVVEKDYRIVLAMAKPIQWSRGNLHGHSRRERGGLVGQFLYFIFVVGWPVLSLAALLALRRSRLVETTQLLWAFLIIVVPFLGAIAFLILRPGAGSKSKPG
jgi:hypothetical protein